MGMKMVVYMDEWEKGGETNLDNKQLWAKQEDYLIGRNSVVL